MGEQESGTMERRTLMRKGAKARFTSAEMKRQTWDRQVAAELQSVKLRQENEWLWERINQLENQIDRLFQLLKDTAAKLPLNKLEPR
jgi:hypothetical protein